MNSLNDILSQRADDLFPNMNNPLSDDDNSTSQTEYTDADERNQTEKLNPTIEDNNEKIDTKQLKSMIFAMKDQLDSMLRLLSGEEVKIQQVLHPESEILETGERVIEGVFNGEKMIGPDGKEYSVPPNYASKSKIVEGDMMKLTITNRGSFIFKQIGPVERDRIVGELTLDPDTQQWAALADGKTYKILTASVTFYKGKSGDEVVLLVPKDGQSEWGAVENIINK